MKVALHKTGHLILVLTTCIFHSAFSQTTSSVEIPRLKEGTVRMSEAMLHPELNIGIFELNYTEGKVSHAYFVVIDYKRKELVTTFKVKSWTYLYSSWIQDDSLLYLSKGMYINRKMIFNLKTGEKIQTKLKSRCHAPEKENGQGVHFGHDDFYCTNSIVYWKNFRMYFNEKNHTLIIEDQ
jgi:hypothetical protein